MERALLGCSSGPESQGAALSSHFGPEVGLLASSPGAQPPEVSGVGVPPGVQMWAPCPLIWVWATRLHVSAGAVYPTFPLQGLRGRAPDAEAAVESSLISC